jgi:hypothetical protein
MKSTDIAMIILIASVSVGVAFGLISAIPGLKMSDEPVKVKSAERYTADIEEPSTEVFKKDAINPTVDVNIGGQTSTANGQ